LAAEWGALADADARPGSDGGDDLGWGEALAGSGSGGGGLGWGEALAGSGSGGGGGSDMMAAMMSGKQPGSPMVQDDIDALFGGGSVETSPRYKNVIDRMIKTAMSKYDKLPMLEVVFDRFVMMQTTSLKKLTSSNADIQMSSIKSTRFIEAMGSIPLPGLLSVVTATPWNGQFVLAMDAPLIYSSLEIMLGGRKSKPARAEGRNFTSIERRLAQKLMTTMLHDLQEAFAPLSEVVFEVDRIEANPQFAAVAQNSSPAVHAVFELTLDDRKGRAEFIVPYATIDPIRKLLQKVFLGEKLGGDPTWEAHLKGEIGVSHVPMRAVFHELETTLGDVLDWRPGQTIELQVPSDHMTTLSSGRIPMFRGRMGQKNGCKAVRVEVDLDGKEELVDGFVAD